MKLEDFLVMIGLKLLVKGYLETTLCYTTPFKNSENYVTTQALIYLSICILIFVYRRSGTPHWFVAVVYEMF